MNQPLDQFISKRFKNTLAVFKSYCRKRSESLEQLKQRNEGLNSSITKYQSIRELRKKQEKNSQSPRKPSKINSGRNQQPVLELKHSDLIEIIKLKLHDSQHKNVHFSTQPAESQEEFKCYPKYKRSNDKVYMTSRSVIGNGFKKKRINLIVKNSYVKMDPHLRTERNMSIEEIIVNLKPRPFSAMADVRFQDRQKSAYSRIKNSSSKHKFSQVLSSTHHKTVYTQNTAHQTECLKDISGWQISGQYQQQLPCEGKRQGVKRSTKRRSKMPI